METFVRNEKKNLGRNNNKKNVHKMKENGEKKNKENKK